MKIQVKALGAIRAGTIDLSKSFCVFCGPNGTGKTYLSYVIYALTKLNNKSLGRGSLSKSHLNDALSHNSFEIEISPKTLFEFRQFEIEKVQKSLSGVFSISAEKATSFFSHTEINSLETEDEFIRKNIFKN